MIEKETYEEKLNNPLWLEKRQRIIRRDGHKCKICSSKDNLQVHHRYYVFKCDPWDYDDRALVTLCESCHKLVHDTLSPLVYSINGGALVRMNFTPCRRCNGYGYLQEYKHIQNGICFRCKGERYEELVIRQTDYSNYISTPCKDIFDTLKMIPNAKELYRKGNELISTHPDISKVYFRKAALAGMGEAANDLGVLIEDTGDSEVAKRWYLYSAMYGIGKAIRNLSLLLKKEGKRELFLSYLKILKKDKDTVAALAAQTFLQFVESDEKPSLKLFFKAIDTLVSFADEGHELSSDMVDQYHIKDLQKALISLCK